MDELSQEILELVKKKMQEQGGYSRDAYREFISETIEFFKERGKITEDDDYEQIEDNLLDRWNEVMEEMGE